MLYTWHTIKGWVVAALAFVACPCHLPITLPLLITLTTGTALGTWLAHNAITAAFISTLIFIGGIILAFKWISESNSVQKSSMKSSPADQVKNKLGLK